LPIIGNGDTVGFASSGIAFIPCSVSITVAVEHFKYGRERQHCDLLKEK
jgi:hypothetical protein